MTETPKTIEPENLYMVYKPSRTMRFWRALGFQYRRGAEPPDSLDPANEFKFDRRISTYFYFDFADRLRLLLTGKLHVVSTVYLHPTDRDQGRDFVQVDVELVAPFDQESKRFYSK